MTPSYIPMFVICDGMSVVAMVDHCCHLYRTNSGWLQWFKISPL